MNMQMWFAARSFRSRRLDTYLALSWKLDASNGATIQRMDEIFGEWLKRDLEFKDTRAPAMGAIHRSLSNGASLAEALAGIVPTEEVLLLRAGAEKGNVAESVQLIVDMLGKRSETQEHIQKMSLMAAGAIASLLGMMLINGFFAFPEFLQSVPMEYWSVWARPGIYAHLWLAKYWWVLSIIPFLVFLYLRTRDSWCGKWRGRFDSLPPWSMYRGGQATGFLGTLAALIESGQTVRQALVTMERSSTPYMRWRIAQFLRKYDAIEGADAVAFRTGFFFKEVQFGIEDAASNRQLGPALRFIGKASMEVVNKAVRMQATASALLVVFVCGILFAYVTAILVIDSATATDAVLKAMS